MNKKCFRNGIRPSSFKQILKKFIFYKKIIKKIFPKKSIFFLNTKVNYLICLKTCARDLLTLVALAHSISHLSFFFLLCFNYVPFDNRK